MWANTGHPAAPSWRAPSHFETEKECKSVLKIAEAELADKYHDRYPLVGSCEKYR